jgi:hypothetical protein
MRAVDLAEMLRQTLDAKINKTRRDILDTYMPIEVPRIFLPTVNEMIKSFRPVQVR